MRKLNESPGGFWDIVARKAKIILEDDDLQQHPESSEAVHRQENNFTTGQKVRMLIYELIHCCYCLLLKSSLLKLQKGKDLKRLLEEEKIINT